MTKIYSVSMNKGGVGKTSVVTNLASAISSNFPDKKILIVDTDGQGNSSIAFGRKPNDFKATMMDVFLGQKSINDVKISIVHNLDLVPANDEMNYLEFDILSNIEKYKKPFDLLKEAIEDVKDQYDYIFFDTPPSMGLVAGNVLAVVDSVLIPFVPETFAIQGLMRVLETIEEFREKRNPNLKIEGVIGMMIDSRTHLHSEFLQQARQFCLKRDVKVFDTIIPRSIRFANSTAYEGKPAVWTDKNNPIVSAYFELLSEVLEIDQKA